MHRKDLFHANLLPLDEFYSRIDAALSIAAPNEYILVSLDFDNFKYINDLFGYETGNKTLDAIVDHFSASLGVGELFCNVNADNFLLFLRFDSASVTSDRLLHMSNTGAYLSKLLPDHYNFVASGGVYYISVPTEHIPNMVDCANFARKKSKGNHSSTFREYSSDMSSEQEWRKNITLNMENALECGEFEMYIQPKVLLKDSSIVGGEALVRWNNKTHGFIFPDNFIPVFEQNGFITLLDFYMLEQACIFLRRCIDEGAPVLPLSVNFSKLHISSTPHFVDKIAETVSKHDINSSLIEVEFTESVLSSNFEDLISIAHRLKKLGFKVSLDDFGNAYSSLNLLKDLPLDIVKLDKAFLDSSANSEKGRLIISKIVELIKSLNLVTVVEGVEHREQVEFLQELGCEYGQGYFYAKPMPANAYYKFIIETPVAYIPESLNTVNDNSVDRFYSVPQGFEMDNFELYTVSQSINMGFMKAYLDFDDPKVQFTNNRALEYLGCTAEEFSDKYHNRILAFTHPDDVDKVKEHCHLLKGGSQTLPFRTKAIRTDGKIITLDGNVSPVRDTNDRLMAIYAFKDISDELNSIEQLKISERRYRIIAEQSEDIMFEWDFITDEIWFSDKFEKTLGYKPYIKDVSTNPYITNLIHRDDVHIFQKWLDESKHCDHNSSIEFRLKTSDGNYLWLRNNSTTLSDDYGNKIKSIGIFSNVTHLKTTMDLLITKTRQDPLTKLHNKESTQINIDNALSVANANEEFALFILDIDNFKGVNDNLGHQFGDAVLTDISSKIRTLFRDSDILGRIGGDEFVIFMRGAPSEKVILSKADELIAALRITYYGENKKYNISCSAGIAYAPKHGVTFDKLYKLADIALYESKKHGKDSYTVYNEAINFSEESVIAGTPVDSNRFLGNYFENDPVYVIFEMLYETKDFHTTINKILELAGTRFNVDRVYIFEFNKEDTLCNNTFEWCASGIIPEIDHLKNIAIEDMSIFFSSYSPEGIFFCNDISSLDEFSYSVLEPQGIKSLLHCAIYDEGKMIGFIGFDDCKEFRQWRGDEIATLAYIARVLSTFIRKKHVSHELLTSYENHMELLNNLPGYVYVINRANYKTLYLNKAIIDLGCYVGQKCHELAFGTSTPCENCPVNFLDENTHSYTTEILSERINGWVTSAASKVRWSGIDEAVLVCCTDISKYKPLL